VAPGPFAAARALLARGAAEGAYSAAVLLAARGDEVLLEASAGQARAASVFDVASLTKPLVASLFFVLVQQGKADPEGVVGEAVPLRFRDPALRGVTFRHLLSHTAGLPAYAPLYEEVLAAEARAGRRLFGTAEGHDMVVERVLSLSAVYPPGASWAYSDLGYIVLGRALELLSFAPLDRLLRRELAEPLGMRDTGYLPLAVLSECETGRLVPTGFSAVRKREKAGEVDDENAAAMGGVAGHAGVFSTARDLFLFAREILRARRARGRVLTRRSAEEMTRRVADPAGCPRTPGFDTPTPAEQGGSQAGRLFSRNTVGHLGFTGCSLWIDLDREITVVLLSDRVFRGPANEGLRALRPALHDAVMEELLE